MLILYPCNLAEFIYLVQWVFCVDSLAVSIHKIVLCSNTVLVLPRHFGCLLFVLVPELLQTELPLLTGRAKGWRVFPASDPEGKAFVFHL